MKTQVSKLAGQVLDWLSYFPSASSLFIWNHFFSLAILKYNIFICHTFKLLLVYFLACAEIILTFCYSAHNVFYLPPEGLSLSLVLSNLLMCVSVWFSLCVFCSGFVELRFYYIWGTFSCFVVKHLLRSLCLCDLLWECHIHATGHGKTSHGWLMLCQLLKNWLSVSFVMISTALPSALLFLSSVLFIWEFLKV